MSAARSALDDLDLVEPANRREWRTWLADNHAQSGGIWLAVGKKGNGVTALTYDDAVEEALCFGWIDSTVRKLDADRYKAHLTPRKRGSIWSATNKTRVERLIEQGLMQPAGLAAIEAAKADGSWTILDTVDALVIPPDLAEALAAHPAARAGFEGLSESTRKIVLYWILTAKRPDTRARRIAETIDAAAKGRSPR